MKKLSQVSKLARLVSDARLKSVSGGEIARSAPPKAYAGTNPEQAASDQNKQP